MGVSCYPLVDSFCGNGHLIPDVFVKKVRLCSFSSQHNNVKNVFLLSEMSSWSMIFKSCLLNVAFYGSTDNQVMVYSCKGRGTFEFEKAVS